MQVLAKSPSVSATVAPSAVESEDISIKVREATLEALKTTGIIRPEEKEGFSSYLINNAMSSGEILPVMAKLRGIEDGSQREEISKWGRALAPIAKKRYSLVPFAGRLLGSTTLFDDHSDIQETARKVLCPLIFTEDIDVLGFGTINPIAGAVLSEFIMDYFKKQNGVTPYISMFLLDLPTWETVCGRQFER